jgi:hypothetical protein
MQRLLGEAVWDADAVREDLRGYMVEELGDPMPLRTLVGVTSARWCIETCFQTDEALGLDEHWVRR